MITQVSPLCLMSTSHAREPCLSRITQISMIKLRIWVFKSGVLKKILILSKHGAKANITEAHRWQIIGMHTTGMSFKAIGRQMGYQYTVVSRLVRKHTQTNNVKDLPRSADHG